MQVTNSKRPELALSDSHVSLSSSLVSRGSWEVFQNKSSSFSPPFSPPRDNALVPNRYQESRSADDDTPTPIVQITDGTLDEWRISSTNLSFTSQPARDTPGRLQDEDLALSPSHRNDHDVGQEGPSATRYVLRTSEKQLTDVDELTATQPALSR